jgi:hypothetical protein
MIFRLFAAASALALVMGGVSAQAQTRTQGGDDDGPQPIVVQIDGDCALAVSGRAEACKGLAYMVFPSNNRKDFTALTSDGGWAFSGREDKKSPDGTYTLLVDSILRPGVDRVAASGQCVMQVDPDDGATVRSLDCQARSANAVLILKASGVAQPGGDGDDDDDDDSRPDTRGLG